LKTKVYETNHQILITSALVVLIANFMTGVRVDGFTTALIVAIVLGLLNIFIKPIIVILTLPITFITLGLFLLVINAIIILLCDNIVGGFSVNTSGQLYYLVLFCLFYSLLCIKYWEKINNHKGY
jgi:putative membrane protein